ncbi:pyridoxal-phosphate dependent enzyme [Streptomyces silvensis]|uniref:PLP-dependent lyase/thiolase n=1 Tax=Streptomyces silvensis TaxID=1765722 RepID=A0A0W7XAD2_9ACTN|nr:pyridoxal-phosphate dependent enzyme [Streptomyces silvensis]KUF19832.1 PLP-dependent lyase/thiolase [Streptomyces silvensis]
MTDTTAPSSPWYAHPAARQWRCPPPPAGVRAFHESLAEYAPTPLTEVPALAAELGVGRVFVKDESARLGLPAFKALGAFWAVHRILARQPPEAPLELVTATDGNHGRAVARIARRLGQRAHVFVSQGVHPGAVSAIEGEGARVTRVAGSYDLAVRAAADAARAQGSVLVQDTAWEGYEEVPAWIVEGYSTLFAEVDAQLAAAGAGAPELVAVPVGVGSLAQAAVTHYRSRDGGDRDGGGPDGGGPNSGGPDGRNPNSGSQDSRNPNSGSQDQDGRNPEDRGRGGRGPALLSVEPTAAAPALAGLLRGEPVPVTTRETVMAGLNCGTVSRLAWPVLRRGLDAAVSVTDADALAAVRDLTALGVSSGPCGAATLAGARAALTGAAAPARRADLAVGPHSTVVLLNTEGREANPYGSPVP